MAFGPEIAHPVIRRKSHPDPRETLHLEGENVARQTVGRDPVAHHPARLLTGIADLHLVAEPREVTGRRQAAGPCADHEHALAGPGPRQLELPSVLARQVPEVTLNSVDRHRAVEAGPIATALARVVADAPMDGSEGVVGHQRAPRRLELACLHLRQVGLDVLARRARGVARWQEFHVDRSPRADGARPY